MIELRHISRALRWEWLYLRHYLQNERDAALDNIIKIWKALSFRRSDNRRASWAPGHAAANKLASRSWSGPRAFDTNNIAGIEADRARRRNINTSPAITRAYHIFMRIILISRRHALGSSNYCQHHELIVTLDIMCMQSSCINFDICHAEIIRYISFGSFTP